MTDLTADDLPIGTAVTYQPRPEMRAEHGVVTSVGYQKSSVMVRYEGDDHSKLTMTRLLRLKDS